MNKISLFLFVGAAALAGCNADRVPTGDFELPPTPDAGPPPTGPVHFVVEGLVDVWIPSDEKHAVARYFPGPEPAPEVNAMLHVTGHGTIAVAGWGFEIYVGSGVTTVTPDLVAWSQVGTVSEVPVDVTETAGTLGPSDFSLSGKVEIDGIVRVISVDGPFYRTCWRMDGSLDPNLDPIYQRPDDPWADPDFGGDCAPFKE